MQEKLDKFRQRFVEEVVFGTRVFGKIARAPHDPQITLNATKSKVPHIHVW